MSDNSQSNRTVLGRLFKRLMDMRDNVPNDGHVDIRNFRDVRLVTQFNFENLDSKVATLGQVPPVWFVPMKLADLEKLEVDPQLARKFLDIDQNFGNSGFPMEPIDRVRQVSTLIEDRTTHEAWSKQNLQDVDNNGWWTTECLVEPCPDNGKSYSHLAFHLLDDKEAREDAILYSELCAIVEAMKGRANQRLVESESVREELDECGGRGKEVHPYLFDEEDPFPVLVVSCVAPQHARLFMACLPANQAQWDRAETAKKLKPRSLRAWPNLKSGSKVSVEQFLLSRVLCPPMRTPDQLDIGQFGITPALLTRAMNLLQVTPTYQLYLQSIGGDNWANPALGPFGPVLRLQAEIRAGWGKGGDDLTDEDTVNSAFIELVNALTSLVPNADSWWRTSKRRLTFTGLRKNTYVAITDGQFEVKATEKIRMPIECKGGRRAKKDRKITQQEVAELAAWVKEHRDAPDSPPVRFRPLAGQCGQEISLESLEYGEYWVKYLRQGRKAGNSFATLHKYGPYNINQASHMRRLAPVIVAMSF
ncbi:uncharacterized protein BO87DRAFT_406217 [Aspergillus neoniger CBS 115656]|uniref:Uncharacterized protein n=1 Tax=Aspergillus neoniger (strain CBS 115656) TaxID=1448310 RepID=A0A318YT07_ASPNB|nr:hypothetical protein BO87DRAFT_406217 [Aspergillus neoniger CBS 115656]PYH35180.1 hypothetical protein BO87DRAFT_406217 [Aspergillus neoniger CBS 115656]